MALFFCYLIYDFSISSERPCSGRNKKRQYNIHATMVFVSSAVLGAATGTGLALLIAGSIVTYRYYVVRRKGREWDELDRWEETKLARKIKLLVSELLRLLVIGFDVGFVAFSVENPVKESHIFGWLI